jgi:hypothetical protein
MKMTITKSLLILVFTSSTACGFLDEDIWIDEIDFEESLSISGYSSFGISSCGGYRLYRRASVTSLDPMIIRIPIRRPRPIDSEQESMIQHETNATHAQLASSNTRTQTPDWLIPFVEASELELRP